MCRCSGPDPPRGPASPWAGAARTSRTRPRARAARTSATRDRAGVDDEDMPRARSQGWYGAHSPVASHCPLQQSRFAWHRRPESCSRMQQRPATHIELLAHVSSVTQHMPLTPAVSAAVASGGNPASAERQATDPSAPASLAGGSELSRPASTALGEEGSADDAQAVAHETSINVTHRMLASLIKVANHCNRRGAQACSPWTATPVGRFRADAVSRKTFSVNSPCLGLIADGA